METRYYDVVILSDLHLGSETSRAREALDLLRSLRFHKLILLGDIFCDLNFRRLNKQHWHFLSYIRKLSNPRRAVEVIWIEGNHDYGLSEVMSHLVGVPVYQEYAWVSPGERHLAIHGHQFDGFVGHSHPVLREFVTRAYLVLQGVDRGRRNFSRLLDRLNTRWQRLVSKVANGALDYARAHGATRIYCGHTHESIAMARDGIHYYNTGAWTSARPTYVTIRGREILLNEYHAWADNSRPGAAAAANAEPAHQPALLAEAGSGGVRR